MIRISSRRLTALRAMLPRTLDFLVIGEMHGSAQNAPIVHKCLRILLSRRKPCAIAFEWALTHAEREALRTYVRGGKVPSRLPDFFLNSDGPFTYEHIALLKWIRAHNRRCRVGVDVYTFDNAKGSGSDHSMAGTLRAYHRRHARSIVLIETGNMHARIFGAKKGTAHASMAALLSRGYSVFSVFLFYQSGKIDIGGKERDITLAESQRGNPEPFFDAMVTIPRSLPSRRPRDLTEILNMLS